MSIKLLTSGLCLQNLPQHSRIEYVFPTQFCRFLYPSWFWHQIIARYCSPVERITKQGNRSTIWHSTYYTDPNHWNGYRVVTVADMIHERYPCLFYGPEHDELRERKRKCVLGADAVICISETSRRDLIAIYGIDPKRVFVVPLAHSDDFIKLNDFEKHRRPTMGRPFLLYVGSRYHYKNFQGFIRSFADWSIRNRYSLFIVGNSLTRAEQQLIYELGINDRIVVFKNINDEELNILYNEATALVYPSLYEGFGIPLLEAMACGCPIVASRIPSTEEIAGDLPIYFDPENSDSLLEALEQAVSNQNLSDRVELGIEMAKNYSWDKTAQQTLEVYHSLG